MSKTGFASSCQGKQAFPSKQAIHKIFSRPGREKPLAYHCLQCGKYHISHQKKHTANRQKLRRYIVARDKHLAGIKND